MTKRFHSLEDNSSLLSAKQVAFAALTDSEGLVTVDGDTDERIYLRGRESQRGRSQSLQFLDFCGVESKALSCGPFPLPAGEGNNKQLLP